MSVSTTSLGADLHGADKYMTSMDYTNFSGCVLGRGGLNPDGRYYQSSAFLTAHQSTFVGSDFSGDSIFWADFSQADLTGANLTNTGYADSTNFTGANLTNADMSNSWFVISDFSNAILHGADIRGTTFAASMLIGADMTGALAPTSLTVCGTTPPSGLRV